MFSDMLLLVNVLFTIYTPKGNISEKQITRSIDRAQADLENLEKQVFMTTYTQGKSGKTIKKGETQGIFVVYNC